MIRIDSKQRTDVRADAYVVAPMKASVINFENLADNPIVIDQPYRIMTLYKEMMILGASLSTSAAAAGITIEFSVINVYGASKMSAFFEDLSIATAKTDENLTIGAAFSKYKPDKFTLEDCNNNEVGVTLGDFTALDLAVTFKGTTIPADLLVSMQISTLYRA